MKRLLACLFLVIGLGLIFSGSTFAKEKVYFCKQPGNYHKIPVISTTPCSKISINSMFDKWKTISAKRYITYIIDVYGQGDAIIQSLYDDFEKHNLGTNIIREITKKEKKKKKTLVAKKKENARISNYSGELDAGGAKGVIALCLNEKDLNKVTLSYFNNLSEYKKNGSFKNGECNYVISKQLNLVLFHFLLTTKLEKVKYEIKRYKAKLYNRYNFSAYDLSPSNMKKWINDIYKIKPKSIYSYASSAYFFAQYILNYKVDLSGLGLKAVICTSEPLFKEQRSFISKALNCPVVNEYGVSESGICAFECPRGGFHIMSENIYLEIVRNGKNIKDGEIGEIVITQLNNFSAPLIRYHTGDLGKIQNKNCACGRGSQILDSVSGRIHDIIITPDKRIVHGEFFSHIMDNAIGVKQFQVIQENLSHIRVKIVKAKSFDKGNEEFIINKIKSQFGPQTNIKLEYFEKLIPNDNGKFSWIISKLKKDQIMQNISN